MKYLYFSDCRWVFIDYPPGFPGDHSLQRDKSDINVPFSFASLSSSYPLRLPCTVNIFILIFNTNQTITIKTVRHFDNFISVNTLFIFTTDSHIGIFHIFIFFMKLISLPFLRCALTDLFRRHQHNPLTSISYSNNFVIAQPYSFGQASLNTYLCALHRFLIFCKALQSF